MLQGSITLMVLDCVDHILEYYTYFFGSGFLKYILIKHRLSCLNVIFEVI